MKIISKRQLECDLERPLGLKCSKTVHILACGPCFFLFFPLTHWTFHHGLYENKSLRTQGSERICFSGFGCVPFKVLMEFCYSIASVLCFAYLAPRHLSLLGSLLFDQGIELLPPAVKSEVLTSGRPGTPSKRIF